MKIRSQGTTEIGLDLDMDKNILNVKCLIITMVICIKEHLSNIWSSTHLEVKPLSASFTKWSNTLTQFVGKLPTNCLRVFDHFVGLTLKGLSTIVAYIKKHLLHVNLINTVDSKF